MFPLRNGMHVVNILWNISIEYYMHYGLWLLVRDFHISNSFWVQTSTLYIHIIL